MKIRTLALAATAAAIAFAPAHADWADDYRAYAAAMQKGDVQGARDAAEGAWRGSREALQPGQNRALLAQNYAELTFLTDPAASVEPWADAVELAEAGYGTQNYSAAEMRFFHNLAQAVEAGGKDRGAVARAHENLRVLREEGKLRHVRTMLVGRLLLARLEVGMHRDKADDVAAALAADLRAMEEGDPDLLAQAEIVRAMVLARSRPYSDGRFTVPGRTELEHARYVDKATARAVGLEEAMGRFDPIYTIGEIPQTYGTAMAWKAAMRGLVLSYAGGQGDQKLANAMPEGSVLRKPAHCPARVTWKNKGITLPALDDGFVGGMAFAFDLKPNGRIKELRMLGEVPESRYSDRVVRDMKRWRADVEGLPKECLTLNLWEISVYEGR